MFFCYAARTKLLFVIPIGLLATRCYLSTTNGKYVDFIRRHSSKTWENSNPLQEYIFCIDNMIRDTMKENFLLLLPVYTHDTIQNYHGFASKFPFLQSAQPRRYKNQIPKQQQLWKCNTKQSRYSLRLTCQIMTFEQSRQATS